jgi:DNA (cytosine-5)-methyltransferase 1
VQYTLGDLFAGAGGLTLGFVDAGFATQFAVESNVWAAQTYQRNFGNHCINEVIENIDQFPQVDVVIGSPPCQGFSNLGSHLPQDPRNHLWKHYLRVLKEIRPVIFVLENVPPFLKSEECKALIKDSTHLGYCVEGKILNSADYGSPQIRKRAIVIGSRVGEVRFPTQTHVDPSKQNLLTSNCLEWVTVRQAIGDLPFEPTNQSLHFRRNPTSLSLARYKHIPPGGNRWDLPYDLMPECWKKKLKGGTDLFGRLHWDKPSVTIRTEFFKPEKGRYLHPEAHRSITHREAARLQGFPDDFEFLGSKIEIAKQIGNAVPIHMARAIGYTVRDMIQDSGF